MPKVVSVINLKGGVGKTQMTVALAEFLVVKHYKKVLVVDLDLRWYPKTRQLAKRESSS